MGTDNLIKVIRASVRPLVTVGLVAALIFWVSAGIEIPREVYGFVGAIIGFWFAARENDKERALHLEAALPQEGKK